MLKLCSPRYLPWVGIVSSACFIIQSTTLLIIMFTHDLTHVYLSIINVFQYIFHMVLGIVGIQVEVKKVAWIEVWVPFLQVYAGRSVFHFLLFILMGGGYGAWFELVFAIPVLIACVAFATQHFKNDTNKDAYTLKELNSVT